MSNECCQCWVNAEEYDIKHKGKIQKYYVLIKNLTCECECHIPDKDIKLPIEINIGSHDSPHMVKKKIKKALEKREKCPSER